MHKTYITELQKKMRLQVLKKLHVLLFLLNIENLIFNKYPTDKDLDFLSLFIIPFIYFLKFDKHFFVGVYYKKVTYQ